MIRYLYRHFCASTSCRTLSSSNIKDVYSIRLCSLIHTSWYVHMLYINLPVFIYMNFLRIDTNVYLFIHSHFCCEKLYPANLLLATIVGTDADSLFKTSVKVSTSITGAAPSRRTEVRSCVASIERHTDRYGQQSPSDFPGHGLAKQGANREQTACLTDNNKPPGGEHDR